jgi:hypothetical protein
MARLGPWLERLFLKSFVDGLHHPAQRADAAEWEIALYRTLNMVRPTPSGRDWFVNGPGLPMQCPFTGERIKERFPVAHLVHAANGRESDERQTLTLFHNLMLHTWHTRPHVTPDENADRTPQGYISYHQDKWWLVNLSDDELSVVGGATIRKNDAVELTHGLAVRMSAGESARIFRIEFLEPQAAAA